MIAVYGAVMRVQLDLEPVGLAPAERFTPGLAAAMTTRLQDLLVGAGYEVRLAEDFAEVDSDDTDWALLTPEEQVAGGFDFTELVIDGPARAVVAVFLRSVYLSTDPDFDADQAATAQVMRVLRAITPAAVLTDDVRHDVERAALQQQVSVDGAILRPVLTWSEMSDRAVRLFDATRSPEFTRPGQERFSAPLATLSQHVKDLPHFHAWVAASPSGSAFSFEVPTEPPFTSEVQRPLMDAMQTVLRAAIDEAYEPTGIPTGLVVDHDEDKTTSALVFDNLLDSGAMDPAARTASYREAPFAWQEITARAARRDPAFQPTWLPEAIELLAAAGTDVAVRTTSTGAGSEPVADDPSKVPAPRATTPSEAPTN